MTSRLSAFDFRLSVKSDYVELHTRSAFSFLRGSALTKPIGKSATGAVPIRPSGVEPGSRPSKNVRIDRSANKFELSSAVKISGR